MFNFHEILFKIGKILDVAVFNDDIKFELSNQIKNLLGGQLDGSLSIEEENLINKIFSQYNDFKKSGWKDFNKFKYSVYNNIDNFLKGNTFNGLMHTVYAKIKEIDIKDIKEELKEPFRELILLNETEEKDSIINCETSTLLIWNYGKFVYLKNMDEEEFRKEVTDLIEEYFLRRSNGLLEYILNSQVSH